MQNMKPYRKKENKNYKNKVKWADNGQCTYNWPSFLDKRKKSIYISSHSQATKVTSD